MPRYHGRRKKRLSGSMIAVIVIGILLVYAGILFLVNAVGTRLEKQDVPEPVGSLDGRFESTALTVQSVGRTWTYRERELTNILLLGIDWDDSVSASSSRYAGQADFLLLITLDRGDRTISTLQLDRDTMTDIRIYGPFGDYTGLRTEQICLSHAYGATAAENCENAVWAVQNLLLDIPIDGYIAMDMSGISALNDALGGITVTLENDFSSVDPSMTLGKTITLQGKQAEYFVRSRMQIGSGTNAARMTRQRAFIREAEKILVQKMNEDLGFVDTLLDAISDYVTTDIDRTWLVDKAYECQSYSRPDTVIPAGSHVVGEDGFMEFYPDEDALQETILTSFFE